MTQDDAAGRPFPKFAIQWGDDGAPMNTWITGNGAGDPSAYSGANRPGLPGMSSTGSDGFRVSKVSTCAATPVSLR